MSETITVQAWCPNCKHFFKEAGLNNCSLVDWSQSPMGGSPAVLGWLAVNSDMGSTVINEDADDCPRFKFSGYDQTTKRRA